MKNEKLTFAEIEISFEFNGDHHTTYTTSFQGPIAKRDKTSPPSNNPLAKISVVEPKSGDALLPNRLIIKKHLYVFIHTSLCGFFIKLNRVFLQKNPNREGGHLESRLFYPLLKFFGKDGTF